MNKISKRYSEGEFSVERKDVQSAFDEYDKSGLPEGYGKPTRYWVLNPLNGRLYPQKAIYGMSKGQSNAFSATNTRKGLEAAGFEIIDVEAVVKSHAVEVKQFQRSVFLQSSDSRKARLERLKLEDPIPQKTYVRTLKFIRNVDVVTERLFLAEGQCEGCKEPAPFKRKSDGTAYLEVHHIEPLSEGGLDTVENTLALCPNCHRKAHVG
ncbi:MAG: HNH endonuclease signature motif containing protein [Sulfitobacter sp.]